MFSKKNRFLQINLTLLFLITSLSAQTIQENRKYEPVVMPPYKLAQFYGIPVDEIFMYAYQQNSQTWKMMPFQIDEVTKGPDPLNPSDSLLFYFIPDEWAIDDHDGILGLHDELVFLIRDLGDQAPPKAWINNEESKLNPRLEIVIEDPIDGNKAYGYLFRSSTINEPVPTPYNMESFPEADSLSSAYYATDIGEYGLIEDINIKEPWGNGKDIFDTQKLRFSGIVDLFVPLDLKMTEENLYLYEEKKFTQNPVVRIVRQAKQTLQIGSFIAHDNPFWVRAKFYPFSGQIEGGASIARDALKDLWPGTDAVVIMQDLRQSWDFNQNAKGMKFFNKHNSATNIDGVNDNVNRLVEIPIKEWNLMTGDQGSFLTFTEFKETDWQDVLLYYWDSEQGGQFDQFIFDDYETGDKVSFGDQGILFRNYGQDDITLALSFTAFFIPEKNLQQIDADHFANNLINPVTVSADIQTDVAENKSLTIPTEIQLLQNNPNPVKKATTISFIVPQKEKISVEIRDLHGRLVKTLANREFSVGQHQISWNGKDLIGETAANGIYFVILKSKTVLKTQKLTILK